MFRIQFHYKRQKSSGERFFEASMTEPDNAMSIPEIIARFMRGHGLAVSVLPDVSEVASSEDGDTFQDDPDMYDPFGIPPADVPVDIKATPEEPFSAPEE